MPVPSALMTGRALCSEVDRFSESTEHKERSEHPPKASRGAVRTRDCARITKQSDVQQRERPLARMTVPTNGCGFTRKQKSPIFVHSISRPAVPPHIFLAVTLTHKPLLPNSVLSQRHFLIVNSGEHLSVGLYNDRIKLQSFSSFSPPSLGNQHCVFCYSLKTSRNRALHSIFV